MKFKRNWRLIVCVIFTHDEEAGVYYYDPRPDEIVVGTYCYRCGQFIEYSRVSGN